MLRVSEVAQQARLVRAAADGDQAAFEQLLAEAKGRIHGMVSNFVDADTYAERETLYSIACESAWRSCRSGNLNPDADFYAQISRGIRHKLITEVERLRAECRWNGAPPVDVDDIGDHEWGSWATMGVNPLRVILSKETLREVWALATDRQREAVARYIGGDTDKRTLDNVYALRVKVQPILDGGSHPTLQPDRHCLHCGGPLTGVRSRVHPTCKSAYGWQRTLAERAAA